MSTQSAEHQDWLSSDHEDDFSSGHDERYCYECGGRGWFVNCPDDLCHGEEFCIHGDPPVPCRACNRDGHKEDWR